MDTNLKRAGVIEKVCIYMPLHNKLVVHIVAYNDLVRIVNLLISNDRSNTGKESGTIQVP